jgi:hypothetical protein
MDRVDRLVGSITVAPVVDGDGRALRGEQFADAATDAPATT